MDSPELVVKIIYYSSFILSLVLAIKGTYHARMLIKNMKKSRGPLYGIELLFESKSNLNKDGVRHRKNLRLFIVFFLLAGLLFIQCHQYINKTGI